MTRLTVLDMWKQTITAANAAFMQNKFNEAESHYEHALNISEKGLENLLGLAPHLPIPADTNRYLAAFVVTHHNFADLLKQRDTKIAADIMCNAHEKIFLFTKHPNEELQASARHHFGITHKELLKFIKDQGQTSRIKQCLLITGYICPCCQNKMQLN